jgi:phytoene dehydrogenase-like protein
MTKSVVIIGAGIAGLAAGCYAQMNGYNTQVFEMHDKPGGLCTAWRRKGYTIDGCLHWLCGSSPKGSYYHFWEELGMLRDKKVVDSEQFYRLEGSKGEVFSLYTNIDRLEQHMLEIAPEDSKFIHEMTQAMRRLTKLNMPTDKAPETYSIIDYVKMIARMAPHMGVFRKWGKMTLGDLAMRFKNPLLRRAFQEIIIPEMSAIAILITIAMMHNKDAGYVIGGSLELSRAIEKRYLELGGKIHYRSAVTKILVENNQAVGLQLRDGQQYKADYVISAADGYTTIFKMLEGKYVDAKVRGYYENLPIFQPLIYVGLGVKRTFEDLPEVISGNVLTLDRPLVLAGQERKVIGIRIHSFDPSLAPQGKTVLTCMLDSTYGYWETLSKDKAAYEAEKARIADAIISVLDKRFPGLAGQVEMQDVATPITFKRYTGNWQGSFEGWLTSPSTLTMQMKKTLPGLNNFYMAGQWVQPGGGIPGGAISGSWAIQLLCKQDGKRFVTSKLESPIPTETAPGKYPGRLEREGRLACT